MKRLLKDLAICGVALIFVMVVTLITYYRLQHPEMTETELFLKIPEALLLK